MPRLKIITSANYILKYVFDKELIKVNGMIDMYTEKGNNRSKLSLFDSINESIQFDVVFGPKSNDTNRPYQKSDFTRGRLVKLIFMD